jgi:hypothetical protein
LMMVKRGLSTLTTEGTGKLLNVNLKKLTLNIMAVIRINMNLNVGRSYAPNEII